MAIVVLFAPLLGEVWKSQEPAADDGELPARPRDLDAGDEIMVELIPRG